MTVSQKFAVPENKLRNLYRRDSEIEKYNMEDVMKLPHFFGTIFKTICFYSRRVRLTHFFVPNSGSARRARPTLFKSLLASAILFGAAISTPVAFAAIDAAAAVVKLRTSCVEGAATLDNCFTDLNALDAWIWGTRNPVPSAASPLIVEIGPGTFTGQFSCDNSGYVSLRGSGMRQTIIQSSASPISTRNCVNLSFSGMTLRNTGSAYGVNTMGGSTFWDYVEIDGIGYAWFDRLTACGVNRGTHYWFNSRITARTFNGALTVAYSDLCDTSWFFASEITATGAGQILPIRVTGEVHVYGSVIRALSNSGVIASSMTAVEATGPGQIHIHGTGIDVISPAANNIIALKATSGAMIHANQAAYNLSTGTGGTVTRIVKDTNTATHVYAPYLWEEHPNPPGVASITGADMAMVTSATSDGHPHLVVQDGACISKWYDAVDRVCR